MDFGGEMQQLPEKDEEPKSQHFLVIWRETSKSRNIANLFFLFWGVGGWGVVGF